MDSSRDIEQLPSASLELAVDRPPVAICLALALDLNPNSDDHWPLGSGSEAAAAAFRSLESCSRLNRRPLGAATGSRGGGAVELDSAPIGRRFRHPSSYANERRERRQSGERQSDSRPAAAEWRSKEPEVGTSECASRSQSQSGSESRRSRQLLFAAAGRLSEQTAFELCAIETAGSRRKRKSRHNKRELSRFGSRQKRRPEEGGSEKQSASAERNCPSFSRFLCSSQLNNTRGTSVLAAEGNNLEVGADSPGFCLSRLKGSNDAIICSQIRASSSIVVRLEEAKREPQLKSSSSRNFRFSLEPPQTRTWFLQTSTAGCCFWHKETAAVSFHLDVAFAVIVQLPAGNKMEILMQLQRSGQVARAAQSCATRSLSKRRESGIHSAESRSFSITHLDASRAKEAAAKFELLNSGSSEHSELGPIQLLVVTCHPELARTGSLILPPRDLRPLVSAPASSAAQQSDVIDLNHSAAASGSGKEEPTADTRKSELRRRRRQPEASANRVAHLCISPASSSTSQKCAELRNSNNKLRCEWNANEWRLMELDPSSGRQKHAKCQLPPSVSLYLLSSSSNMNTTEEKRPAEVEDLEPERRAVSGAKKPRAFERFPPGASHSNGRKRTKRERAATFDAVIYGSASERLEAGVNNNKQGTMDCESHKFAYDQNTGGRRHKLAISYLEKRGMRKQVPWPTLSTSWLTLTVIYLLFCTFSCGPTDRKWRSPALVSAELQQPEAEREYPNGKLDFWRQLIGRLLDSSGDNLEQTAPSVELLAGRLNDWPDQRQAALFYLDLAAKRARSSPGDRKSAAACRWPTSGVSLAQLESAREAPIWRAPARNDESYMRRLVELDELSPVNLAPRLWQKFTDESRKPPAGSWTTGSGGRAAGLDIGVSGKLNEARRLAVENANLISRLLIQPENELINWLASEKFFNYLLESRMRQLGSERPELHSLGLWFSDRRENWRQFGSESSSAEVSASDPEAGSGSSNSSRHIVVFSRRRADVGVGRELPSHAPFLRKWALLAEGGDDGETGSGHELRSMERRLSRLLALNGEKGSSANQDPNEEEGSFNLRAGDGRWFSPYYYCPLSNSWLITYSIPFFASVKATSAANIKFRGVSFVNLDFGQLKLIDQCDQQEASFFANTHHCARIQRSQCVPVLSLQDKVQSGAYVCQCPLQSLVSGRERRQSEDHRTRLIGKLVANETTNPLAEQLNLDTSDDPMGDKQFVAGKLLEQSYLNHNNYHNKQRSSNGSKSGAANYFVLGSQLQSDATLNWILDERLQLPAQTCRLCQTTTTKTLPSNEDQTSGSNLSMSSGESQRPENELEPNCRELPLNGEPVNWIRPLVLTLQSVCLLLALALAALLFRIRKSRIILVSGWLMLETTLLGAILLYMSVLVHYFEPPTSFTCLLGPWLRELGFSIFHGSILIKLYRILTEFQTRKAHRVCFRDKDQIIYLLAIVLIVVGYMSAWTALMVDGFLFGARDVHSSATDQSHRLQTGSGDMTFPLASGGGSFLGAPLAAAHLSRRQLEMGPEVEAGMRQQLAGAMSYSTANMSQRLNYSVGSSLSSAVDRLADLAPEQLRLFASQLNSISDLFSGLVEKHQHYDLSTDSLSLTSRCRKLTWDYVTELSEMGMLFFGIYLVYKLRNASSEVHRDKLMLSSAVFIELLVSGATYLTRHLFWNQLTPDQILLLYCVRCQLTVTVIMALVFGPKIYSIGKSKPQVLFSLGGSRGDSSNNGSSMRHRCHIACEIHDHHLNDAMRLHQAMLSNAALDIGTIDLSDMDPDEIQAELKRVYAQLEVLKTKAMRRDNPHISKRRGGRKTGHRKFSLQAFHAKHLGGGSVSQQQQQPNATAGETGAEQQGKLPVLMEQEAPATGDEFAEEPEVEANGGSQLVAGAKRRDEQVSSDATNRHQLGHTHSNNQHDKQTNHQQQQAQVQPQHHRHIKQMTAVKGNGNQSSSVELADPVSTSSTGGFYFD